MEVLAAILTVGMLLAPHAVIAELASDLNSHLPINIIFDNAFTDGSWPDDIYDQIAAANQGLSPAATIYAACNKL